MGAGVGGLSTSFVNATVLQGCEPVECKSPRNLTSSGYMVLLGCETWGGRSDLLFLSCFLEGGQRGGRFFVNPRFENSKQLPDFNVKAECLDKFLGTPKVTPCESHEEVYNLTGRLRSIRSPSSCI